MIRVSVSMVTGCLLNMFHSVVQKLLTPSEWVHLQKMLIQSGSRVLHEVALVRSALSLRRADILLNTIWLLNIGMEARALDVLKYDVFLVWARN